MIDNVMNGRTKKQIFFLVSLIFSTVQLSAMCPQTVGTTTPGEGMWNVLTRVGAATNAIQSQICSLDLVFSGSIISTNFECSFPFGQSDIGSGGVYTITTPGTYCMSENINFTTGDAITINSNDVVIDMKGHTLNGGMNAVNGIVLANGIKNVTIKNGFLNDIWNGLSNTGNAITDFGFSPAATSQNITIQNMNFNNNEASAINLSVNNYDGLLIENCKLSDSAGIRCLFIESGVIRECVSQERKAGTFAGVAISGTVLNAKNFFSMEDCVFTASGVAVDSTIEINDVGNATLKNCVVQGSSAEGFIIDGCQNIVMQDCSAQACGSDGYTFEPAFKAGAIQVLPQGGVVATSIIMTNCDAQRCGLSGTGNGFSFADTGSSTGYSGIKLTKCVADNNVQNGFLLTNQDALSSSQPQSIVFKDCYASSNGICGFVVISYASATVIESIIFDGCVAQNSATGDGFALVRLTVGAGAIQNVLFRNCIAQDNSFGGVGGGTGSFAGVTFIGDGFSFGTATGSQPGVSGSCSLTGCVSNRNHHDGFGMDTSPFSVSHCIAYSNTAAGFRKSSFVAGNSYFIANQSFRNFSALDYVNINSGGSGQPTISAGTVASVQSAAYGANLFT